MGGLLPRASPHKGRDYVHGIGVKLSGLSIFLLPDPDLEGMGPVFLVVTVIQIGRGSRAGVIARNICHEVDGNLDLRFGGHVPEITNDFPRIGFIERKHFFLPQLFQLPGLEGESSREPNSDEGHGNPLVRDVLHLGGQTHRLSH